jgi:glutamate decarboxylase
MTESDFQALLDQHFTADSLDGQPEAARLFAGLMDAWLQQDGGQPYPSAPLANLAGAFAGHAAPVEGIKEADLARELGSALLPNTARLHHPLYLGHMTQALPCVGIAADALASALNQNQVKIETAYASTLLERQLLRWLHHAAFGCDAAFYAALPDNAALGNMVSGGTLGNLTALATALEHALPGVREKGLLRAVRDGGWDGLAVLGSTRMHYSLKKACATMGLGSDALHAIPVDRDNRIDLPSLRTRIAELKQANVKIVALVGIAGTTETGSIDPLAGLADIAREEEIWFHVDAAWGGALLLSPRHRTILAGIERADSVVMDGHKLMFVPMAQGTVLFRDPASLDALRHHANYILRPQTGDLGQTSLEGSRRFDALKLWAVIRCLGSEGYAAIFDHLAGLSASMAGLMKARPRFELVTESRAFILTFRYVPPGWRTELDAALARGDHEMAAAVNDRISRLNEAVQEALKAGGEAFFSRTVLESTRYRGEITVLRAVLTNVRTTDAHLGQALDLVEKEAGRLL